MAPDHLDPTPSPDDAAQEGTPSTTQTPHLPTRPDPTPSALSPRRPACPLHLHLPSERPAAFASGVNAMTFLLEPGEARGSAWSLWVSESGLHLRDALGGRPKPQTLSPDSGVYNVLCATVSWNGMRAAAAGTPSCVRRCVRVRLLAVPGGGPGQAAPGGPSADARAGPGHLRTHAPLASAAGPGASRARWPGPGVPSHPVPHTGALLLLWCLK